MSMRRRAPEKRQSFLFELYQSAKASIYFKGVYQEAMQLVRKHHHLRFAKAVLND